MRKQVGWYNPKSGGLCMKHDKAPSPAYEMYTVPVFADDTVPAFVVEDDVPPVPECKKPRDDKEYLSTNEILSTAWYKKPRDKNDELMNEIRAQTLENQVAMLLAMLPPMYNGVEKIDTVRNLTNVRAESVKLLERLKKNEDHSHKS